MDRIRQGGRYARNALSSVLPAVLLAGCGDIALRLSRQLDQRFSFAGLRRHPEVLPATIQPLAADVCDLQSVLIALRHRRFDYVVITLTPGERSAGRYQQVYVEGTRHLLQALEGAPKVLFVSSTSVYGQQCAEWVDEQSVAEGDGFSGRALLEAEHQVMASGRPATCIRFSGIYGPGRERLLRMVREGRVDPEAAGQFTNRIHADDAARVLAFLMSRWEEGVVPFPTYVASDTRPVQAGIVWQWLAQQMGVSAPQLPVHWESCEITGKRCNSQRLQSEGFVFQYPDFSMGYQTLLQR